MPLARINNKILFFIHIPKTGGSSIERFLADHGALALFNTADVDWMKCSSQHIHHEIHQQIVRPNFFDASFAIVRDPVQRLVSEYSFRRKARKTPMPEFPVWVRNVFQMYKTNKYILDNHIRPQTEFLRAGCRIFQFESGLEQVFAWLTDISGLKLEAYLPPPLQ
ncbi:MAG: sulfotransferase family 2 domain-containing protein [Jhaorihella sp.]